MFILLNSTVHFLSGDRHCIFRVRLCSYTARRTQYDRPS